MQNNKFTFPFVSAKTASTAASSAAQMLLPCFYTTLASAFNSLDPTSRLPMSSRSASESAVVNRDFVASLRSTAHKENWACFARHKSGWPVLANNEGGKKRNGERKRKSQLGGNGQCGLRGPCRFVAAERRTKGNSPARGEGKTQ